MNNNENKFSQNTWHKVCKWCSVSLTLTNSVQKTVCFDCYRKLCGAGLRDHEILDSKDSAASKIER